MQYRTFGRAGFPVSPLGFGCMRLPVLDGEPMSAAIDEEAALGMIRRAIDGGVNYVDTAYPYHRGQSEVVVGRALQDGYRKRVHLATKLPVWLLETPADCDRYLDEQLTRLQTDRIDLYLLHSLDAAHWKKVRELGVLEFLDRATADGRIGLCGFSFHDELPLFREIIDARDWSFCQIMLNYLDAHFQAGVEGLRHAHARGLAVVVMEPLKGGRLAAAPPEVASVWQKAPERRSPVEWALRWVWNFPEVSVVLSGMSTPAQVEENLRLADEARPGALSAAELSLIEEARAAYQSRLKVGCTGCGYCQPCPSGVRIPSLFELYNDASAYGLREHAQRRYNKLVADGQGPAQCVECGVCEESCPQHLPIRERLKEVRAELE